MYDLHISDFYKDTARIILTLYQRFPTKTTLYVEDICGPDTPDDFGLHSPRHQACFSSIVWLAEENYLRYSQTMQQDAFDEAVLSQACFTHFSSLIYDEEAQTTKIAKLKDLVFNKSSLELDTFMHSEMRLFAQK